MQRAELKEWSVESYRAAAFLDPAKATPQGGLWERLTGQPPDDIQQQPRAGVLVEQGMLEAALMTVSWQPGRVDLVLTYHPASGSVPPVIGAYPALDDDFRRMAEAFLSSLSDRVLRVAFGLVMRLPAADQLGAYAQLEPYLSRVVKFALDGSVTGFTYQINRVRPSRTNEGAYKINRFSKWYTIYDFQMSVMVGDQPPVRGMPGKVMAAIPTAFASRMELDTSTDAQRTTPIPPEHLLPLFTELRDAALEIAREGDVP